MGLQNSGKTTLVNVIAVCIHSSNIHHYNLIHICTLVNTNIDSNPSFGIFNALLHVTLYTMIIIHHLNIKVANSYDNEYNHIT